MEITFSQSAFGWNACDKGLFTDWNRYSDKFAFLQRWSSVGDEVAEQNANDHGEKDPECEQTVKPTKGLECL